MPAGRFHADSTHKWVPNLTGLLALVEDAGFLVQRSALREDRGVVHAEIENDPEKMRIIEMDRGLRDAP